MLGTCHEMVLRLIFCLFVCLFACLFCLSLLDLSHCLVLENSFLQIGIWKREELHIVGIICWVE